jgi:hypothetical protein
VRSRTVGDLFLTAIGVPPNRVKPTVGVEDEESARRLDVMSAISGLLTAQDRAIGDATAYVGGNKAEHDPQLVDTMSALTRQIATLEQAARTNSEALEANTKAALDGAINRLAGGVAEARQLTSGMAGGILGSAFSPLVRGILGIFRRKDQEAEIPLNIYTPPSPIRLEAAVSETGEITPISYGQGGAPRPIESRSTTTTQPIVIQVQAMDSRSFVDHSDEIARAVREALLSNHMIHDAIRDV